MDVFSDAQCANEFDALDSATLEVYRIEAFELRDGSGVLDWITCNIEGPHFFKPDEWFERFDFVVRDVKRSQVAHFSQRSQVDNRIFG